MSTYETTKIACPRCATDGEHAVAVSVNAARRPALREEIAAGRFHRYTCGHCAAEFAYETTFTYLDFERDQFVMVFPPEALPRFRECEKVAAALFERTLAGPDASAAARRRAEKMALRVCFGLEAFREKVVCAEGQIDEVAVELAKLQQLKDGDAGPWPPRVTAISDGRIVFSTGSSIAVALLPSPKEPRYEALAARLGASSFLDAQRILLP